ncbi:MULTISPECIES: hypothetical protein [Dyadobacter]|uniref:AraC-like protein n=1 Tax=Dyadobacter chenhuakuii TaxID=2909339 RepID=A0A9X1QKE4_9BACT|nr:MULTISPECIES: hypothetical protein [Dyadobacter]MCF2501289.1 hypothetical protein [Dyadobacter chenhuakuii]MCF2502132.1 hypothetical protein [Dyadobacter fanqingshengii]
MRNCNASPPENAGNTKQKRFKVYKTGVGLDIHPAFTRRDFAKIYLIAGNASIHACGKTIYTSEPILLFEPLVPYSLHEIVTDTSFTCLFSQDLLHSELCSKVYHKLMAFAASSEPVIFSLDSKQKNFITFVFEQIILEQDTAYTFSHELFCNYMNLIFHEVLKKTTGNKTGYQLFHLN